jgi:hypothetical protein
MPEKTLPTTQQLSQRATHLSEEISPLHGQAFLAAIFHY